VGVDPTTQTAYVTSGNSVTVLDIASGSITGAIKVGKGPDSIEVDSSTRTVFVANATDNSVSVIDAESGKFTATIEVGDAPDRMGVDTAFVPNAVTTPRRCSTSRSGPSSRPSRLAINRLRRQSIPTRTPWVVNFTDNTISVIKR
jgi:YVTN family beta-propeller protein